MDDAQEEPSVNCGCDCSGAKPSDGEGNCTPPESNVTGSARSGPKLFVFTFVMVVAIGLAGYSFSKRFGDRPIDTAALSCGPTLASVKAADNLLAENKVVFVFLPGDDPGIAQNVSARVNALVGKLGSQGKRVAAITLEKDTEGYAQLLKDFSLQSFPSVIVAGNGCQFSALTDDITEEKLLRAYVLATTPLPSCAQGSSSCCPK